VDQETRINNGFLQAENQYFQISRMYIIIVLCSFSAFFSFSTWRDDRLCFSKVWHRNNVFYHCVLVMRDDITLRLNFTAMKNGVYVEM